MKTAVLKYAFIFTLLAAGFPGFAQDSETGEKRQNGFTDNFAININFGNIGFGGIFPFADYSRVFELGIEVLPFGFEHLNTRLGIWFSPVSFFYMNNGGIESSRASLINTDLYWNALPGIKGNTFLGPFTHINYLVLENGAHWEKYTLTAGVRWGFRINEDNFRFNLISAETGVRFIDGKGSSFLTVKMDFAIPAVLIVQISKGMLKGLFRENDK